MNGFLFTKDGKLICELTEISFEPYKDKRIIKVRCTVCGRIKRIQKWKFDFAMNRQFPASVAVQNIMQAALLASQNVGSQRALGYHKSNKKSA